MDKLAFKYENSHTYNGQSKAYFGGSMNNYANMHSYHYVPNSLKIAFLAEDESGEPDLDF